MFSTSHILSMPTRPEHTLPPCQAGARWWRALRTLPGIGASTQPERQGLQCSLTGVAHGHFSRRDCEDLVELPRGSRDAPASCAAYRGANHAFEDLLAQPPPPSRCCVSRRRKPATKVNGVISPSNSGGNGGRTSIGRDGVRKGRRLGLCIDQDPPMGSPFGSRHAKKWRSSREALPSRTPPPRPGRQFV